MEMNGRHSPQQLTPRSPKVLLHCMKPFNKTASKVPPKNLDHHHHTPAIPKKYKKKCQEILRKENDKEKKSKQKEILIQQLVTRLGRNKINKITYHVDKIFNQYSTLPAEVLSILEKSILEEEKSQLSHHTSESVDSQADVQEPNQVLETNTDSPEVQSSSPNMALPHGSEKKALTSLQDSEQANRQKKNGVLTSSQLSEELARQISLKKKQIRQERESDQMYFTEVVLKDIQKYHQECKEKELNRFKSSQLYRELLGQQKLTEACSRNVDERESDMLQALKEKEKYEKEEKILQEKKKQMQLKYRNELIQQIKEQQLLNQSDDVMNNAERSINHRELSQLTNDPIKYQKVQQMLQIYAPQSSISSASNQSPVKRGRRLKGLKGL